MSVFNWWLFAGSSCSAQTTTQWVMTTSVKHTFSHLICHFTKRPRSSGSSMTQPSHTHRYIRRGYRAALPHTPPPHLTLSGGVWKTGPQKPAGHVDYHFNGLARWKCWFFGAEIIYCSHQSKTGLTKGKGLPKKKKKRKQHSFFHWLSINAEWGELCVWREHPGVGHEYPCMTRLLVAGI